MVSILMYYLLLVYQLATLTNLTELDNASKSIDIVSNTISDTGLNIFTVRRRDWGSDRNLSNAPACRNT